MSTTNSRARRRVIFVVGPSCSGKTLAARIFHELRCDVIDPSVHLARHVPASLVGDARAQAVEAMFRTHGRDVIGQYVLREALDSKAATLVVPGCRQPIEPDALRPTFDVSVLAISADDTVRWARAKARKRPDQPASYIAFLRSTAWEYSLGLAELILRSDHIVPNNSTAADLQEAIKAVVRTAGWTLR